MSDIMIDIETAATTADATILTIAAQGFIPETGELTDATYYERLTVESQEDRRIDDNTLAWWSKQSLAVQNEAFGDGDDRIALDEALDRLTKVVWQHSNLWANGITFDFVILEHALQSRHRSVPWQYWQLHDARTMYKVCPVDHPAANDHNALADCINQIEKLHKVYKKLGLAG